MRYTCLIFLFSFLISCNSGEVKEYTISDIKFPEDNIRKAIEQNRICNTYFYYAGIKVARGKQSSLTGKCDSTITDSYDLHGNVIKNIDGVYEYDDENQIIFSNSGRCLSSTSYYRYAVNSKERILYQIRTDKRLVDATHQHSDTFFYYFDVDGKITSTKYNSSDEGATYQYDSSGKIMLISFPDSKKRFFYTGNKLDSIYFEISEDRKSYVNKYFYDHSGLLCKKIEYSDHVPYFPYSIRPLITYVARHVKCGQ